MDFECFIKDDRWIEWLEYAPGDLHYAKYAKNQPDLIAAAHKIVDVYYGFCGARTALMNVFCEDLGTLATSDEISYNYQKSQFYISAILKYSLCLDLSWQVVWSFVQPASLSYLANLKYLEMEKECTLSSVNEQLNCCIAQNPPNKGTFEEIKKLINEFNDKEIVQGVRNLYNIIKHRGAIMFKELPLDNEIIQATVNGIEARKLHRPIFTFKCIEELLFEYHESFVNYFNELIQAIMPEEFKGDQSMQLIDYFNGLFQYTAEQNPDLPILKDKNGKEIKIIKK